MFASKTSCKFVFLVREVHFPAQLDIRVLYISFKMFYKIQNFTSKSKVVSFQFIEKSLFAGETNRNPYFFSRESQNSKQLALIRLFAHKKWSKIYISLS
jgi:hypothetical protein